MREGTKKDTVLGTSMGGQHGHATKQSDQCHQRCGESGLCIIVSTHLHSWVLSYTYPPDILRGDPSGSQYYFHASLVLNILRFRLSRNGEDETIYMYDFHPAISHSEKLTAKADNIYPLERPASEQDGDLQIKVGVEARPPGDARFPSGKSSTPIRDASLGEKKEHQARLLFNDTQRHQLFDGMFNRP